MFSILQMLGRFAPVIDIVDVGAMWLGADEVAYKALVAARACRVVGFEPVQAECDKLNAMGLKNHTFLPYFIGDGTERRFHLCNYPMTSSLYPPNTRLLARFQNLEELTRTVETSTVQTRRLDDIDEIPGIDYIKVDVQGGELDVFKGGEKRLRNALVVETEVEFLEMYVGQPLFAEVDQELRRLGYVFHTFRGMAGRAYKPFVVGNEVNRPLTQMIWANAVYVRDFMRFGDLTAEQLVKVAVILHEICGAYDLAALALQHHDAKTGKDLWSVYARRVFGGDATPPPPLD